MVENKVLIGVITGEYARRADFYDYLNLLIKPTGSFLLLCHDRSPAHGRNLVIKTALEQACSHVLFIDDDMAYKSNALLQLLEHDADIVSGLYLIRSYPHQPLIFETADDDGSCLYAYLKPNEERLKPIVAAGLGFCLIKTSVFKMMEQPWIRLGELDKEQWCDDIGFFNRVRQAGIQSYCDTECRIGHMGTIIYWPERDDNGEWFTEYDNNGSGRVKTPQFYPKLAYKFEGK